MTKHFLPLALDKLDYQIIKCLNSNIRITSSEIAKLLNSNQRTVHKRMERLFDLGVVQLKGWIEPKAFGYGIAGDIILSVDPNKKEEILKKLESMNPISYIAIDQTPNEISIQARFRDPEEMSAFVKTELGAIEGLKIIKTTIAVQILKNIVDWTPPENIFKH